MEKTPEIKVKNGSKFRKRLLWTLAVIAGIILLILATAFIIGYYCGSKMVKSYLEAKVKEQTKGLYTLQMKDLDLILVPGRIKIEGLSLVPDTARYRELQRTDTISPILLTLHIAKVVVADFDVFQSINDKEIQIGKILVKEPVIELDEYDHPPNRAKPAEKHTLKLSLSLPEGLNLIDIGQIRLSEGQVIYRDHRNDTLRETGIPEFSIEVDNLHVDSTMSKNLFNAEDIRVVLKGIAKTAKNGMNSVSYGEIGLSTGKKELYVKDFHLKPEVSKEEYGKKLGFQTDWMELKVSELRLSEINIPLLLLHEYFQADKLSVKGIELVDYRDKRNPPRKNWKPKMPHEALTNLKVQLRIDSVFVSDGKITYQEQTGDKPGTIFFTDVNVAAGPLSNDSVMMATGFTMRVRGNAKLLGSGNTTLAVDFPMPAKDGRFSFSGLLTGLDMTKLNPFVSALIPAKIVSGYIDRLAIMPVYANSKSAQGKLILAYHNLELDLPPQSDKKWESIKKSVISWAANTYVASSNPSDNGKLREGIIFVERDPTKSIFNYLWKSVFSGVKSTVNVNTKAQKEIRKQTKQDKHTKKN